MKTSIKLLIGITIAVVLMMVGAGWSFRQQYDQLDHKDPFAQFSRKTLPPFRVLKLTGSPNGVFLIQPGPMPVIRVDTDHQNQVTYQSVGDTLRIRYVPTGSSPGDNDGIDPGTALRGRPIAIVSVPVLELIRVDGAVCTLANWTLTGLTLIQTGKNGGTALRNTTIDALQVTVTGGSALTMSDKNTIGQAWVTLKDHADFQAGDAHFTSLVLRADTATRVTLPGALLAKIR